MLRARCAGLTIVLSALAAAAGAAPATAADPPVVLVPHRAVYDMSLAQVRTGSSITGVRGRMVFELTGSQCEGYTQNMRFVTEMSSQDAPPVLTDLRSSTFEDGAAALFRFNTTQLRDQKAGETTVGDAKRATATGPVTIELTKPDKATKTLRPGTYFPIQHSIALIVAGRAGVTTLRADLYDGSEKGDKAYDTLARIGRKADKGANKQLPAVKNAEALDALAAWPVSISYFEMGKDKQDATPVYELSFLFFENGVSRKLVIDYGDFAIKGEVTDLTFSEPSKCEAK